MRTYIEHTSTLRLFFLSLPFLFLAYQVLSFLVPVVLRVLVPHPLRLILGLF
jgi:hypothetical protein